MIEPQNPLLLSQMWWALILPKPPKKRMRVKHFVLHHHHFSQNIRMKTSGEPLVLDSSFTQFTHSFSYDHPKDLSTDHDLS